MPCSTGLFIYAILALCDKLRVCVPSSVHAPDASHCQARHFFGDMRQHLVVSLDHCHVFRWPTTRIVVVLDCVAGCVATLLRVSIESFLVESPCKLTYR